jgi:hypothetical protein
VYAEWSDQVNRTGSVYSWERVVAKGAKGFVAAVLYLALGAVFTAGALGIIGTAPVLSIGGTIAWLGLLSLCWFLVMMIEEFQAWADNEIDTRWPKK